MNNSMTIKQYTDIPFIKRAVDELNMDIKNNPGLKYEIVGYSICKDETLCITLSSMRGTAIQFGLSFLCEED